MGVTHHFPNKSYTPNFIDASLNVLITLAMAPRVIQYRYQQYCDGVGTSPKGSCGGGAGSVLSKPATADGLI